MNNQNEGKKAHPSINQSSQSQSIKYSDQIDQIDPIDQIDQIDQSVSDEFKITEKCE